MTADPENIASRPQPWKSIGYPKFANFITSSNDFFILRRFSALTARVLLAAQDELVELEGQLSRLDTQVAQNKEVEQRNDSFRYEALPKRLELIHEIDGKLRAYNDLVLQHSQLRARQPVETKDITSLSNWFHNHPHAIKTEETDYVNHASDLFRMVPKVKIPLRRFLERSLHFRLARIWRHKDPENDDENVHYTFENRIDYFVGAIIMAIGLAMLIAPLWLLAGTHEMPKKLGIITAFIFSFVVMLSSMAAVKPFECLAGAAAYAAVLAVFLQNT